ncbi:MAG: hypothetical protein ACRELD_12010, partial [Longimicrobiales bacterium]
YGPGAMRDKRRAWARSLAELTAAYPDDDEAAAFHALAVLAVSSHRGAGRERILGAAARLERIFARNPDHPGVAHYLIHAYDDPDLARRGLAAARRYDDIAPAAYHARHMPAHIYRQLGMWEEVANACASAYEASVAWVEREGLADNKRDFHSLRWLQTAYVELGRLDDAQRLIEHVAQLVRDNPADREIRGVKRDLERALEGADLTDF